MRVCGVDEAGRGPLAGPVYAAAVILDPEKSIAGLKDSKLLTAERRTALLAVIQTKALAWSIAFATVEEIDRMNILQASLLAMQRAVAGLPFAPDEAWVDGNRPPSLGVPVRTIVSGDRLHPCISAASILAKTARDAEMVRLQALYPQYGLDKHKGYSTAAHLEAIRLHGVCEIYRNFLCTCTQGDPMPVIRSRENARVKEWVRLAAEPRARRERRLALIEGVHLIETFIGQGGVPASLIVSEAALARAEIADLAQRPGARPFVLAEALFKRISDTESPSGIAAEIAIPDTEIDPGSSAGCVFLDGLQDAGNIGAILRTVAAFGVQDVLIGRGCADPWSPKALRAGMGGHFFLRIAASADLAADVARFGGISICTVAHGGAPIDSIDLAGRVAWIFGSEGAGVSAQVEANATHRATIPTPGGAESLNVAASAAVCLYERQRQLSTRGAGS